MSRFRGVGKQAAGALDFLQKRDLDAFSDTLPLIYVQRSLFNQPQGVPQLDVNSRMGNTYLPTDIARSTLTASGKTKGGTLEVTGAGTIGTTLGVTGQLTSGSAVVQGNESVGGTLTVTGAISGASVNVGNGALTALTADIPEITSTTFKAKATTLNSLNVTGQTSLVALTTTGDISTQSIGAAALTTTGAVTAGGEVRGATVKSDGSLTVDGAASLQAATVNGALIAQSSVTATGQMRANGGLRLGVSQLISQVDGSNNGVPVNFSNGIAAGGAISGVTTLNTSGAATIGGALGVSGKGTFGDLQSNSNLVISGTLTGVTDLTIGGNLNVNGAAKRISTTELATGILSASGLSSLAAVTITGATALNGAVTVASPLTIPAATADTHAVRRVQVKARMNERFPSAKPTVAHNAWTPIGLNTWGANDSATLSRSSDVDYVIQRSGVWQVAALTKWDYINNNGTRVLSVYLQGASICASDTVSYDGYLACSRTVYMSQNQVVRLMAFHFTGGNLQMAAGVHGTCLTLTWLGE